MNGGISGPFIRYPIGTSLLMAGIPFFRLVAFPLLPVAPPPPGRYPIGPSLLMAGILFIGLVAYPLLPVAPLPQVDFPTIQVTANLPGASPETMASSVAQPLERQFAQIPGIAQMTSTSYLGTAAV